MKINIRTDILLRVYLAFGLILLLAFAVLYKLYTVQFVQGNKWKGMADSLSTRFANVEAVRGNIYSVDGSLLATSVPEYDICTIYRGYFDILVYRYPDTPGYALHQTFTIFTIDIFSISPFQTHRLDILIFISDSAFSQ